MLTAAGGGGAGGVVLYLDDIFFFNFAMDGLVIYLTALWGGLPIRGGKIVLVAMVMILIAFGGGKHYFRLVFLFVILACMLGGAMVSLSQRSAISDSNDVLIRVDWKVFLLVTVVCYFVLSVVFRGDARHEIKRQLKKVTAAFRIPMINGRVICR